jgi:hypothetical protein
MKREATRLMTCPLCEREVPCAIMERHHLRTLRESDAIERLCRECHKTIHGLFTREALRDPRNALDTVAGLLANPQFARALRFIRTVPPGGFMKMKERNR